METSGEIRVNTATTCPGAAARDNYRFCVFIIMGWAKNASLFQGVDWFRVWPSMCTRKCTRIGLSEGNLKCTLLCTCYWIRGGSLGCHLIGLSSATYSILLPCPGAGVHIQDEPNKRTALKDMKWKKWWKYVSLKSLRQEMLWLLTGEVSPQHVAPIRG